MVSFSCEVCNDTVIKKKLDQHRQRCSGAYFTCIDCSTTFNGVEYRNHTQCISEAEKYEKSLYKGKKTKDEKKQLAAAKPKEQPRAEKEQPKEKKAKKEAKSSKPDLSQYSSGSLYKVVKDLSKNLKKDKKDVLKQLQVSVEDGKLVVTL